MIRTIQVSRISRLAFITATVGLTVQLSAPPPRQPPGVQVIAPALVGSTAGFGLPTITAPTTGMIAPLFIDRLSTVQEPQVLPGEAGVQPEAIAPTSAVLAPSLARGAVTVTPALIASASNVRSPAVTSPLPVENGISPLQISATSIVGMPEIVVQAATLAPSVIASGANVRLPVVTAGAVTVSPALIEPVAYVQPPSVLVGMVAVEPAIIAATALVPSPTVAANAIPQTNVAPATIASTASVTAPLVSAGAVSVAPAMIAAASSVRAPTVAAGTPAQSIITPPAIAATSTMAAPAVAIRAPLLTDLRSIGGNLNGLGYATTDTDNGVMYFYVSRSPITPSVATIKSGSGAARAESRNVNGAAEYSFIFSLADANPYYPYFLHTVGGTLDSVIAAGPIIAKQQNITPAVISTTTVPAPIVTGGQGGNYDPASQAYFGAMTVQPDAARKALIDTFIKAAISNGYWSKLDWFVLLAAHDAQAARLNAVNPAKALATVNSPIFTVDRGYMGDGSGGYLSFGESIGAAGKATVNSTTIGVWCNQTNGTLTGLSPHFGRAGNQTPQAIIRPQGTSGSSDSLTLNDNTGNNVRTSTGTRNGHRSGVRNDGNLKQFFFNGSRTYNSTGVAAVGISNGTMVLLRNDTAYSVDQLAAAYTGGALTEPDQAALHNDLSALLTAIGAN